MTRSEADVLAFIGRYQSEHGGASPSFEEMRAAIDGRSKSFVYRVVHSLEGQGRVRLEKANGAIKQRSIVIVPQRVDLSGISDADIAAEYFRRIQSRSAIPPALAAPARDVPPVVAGRGREVDLDHVQGGTR